MDAQKKLSLLQLSSKLYKSSWPKFHCPKCGNYAQKLSNLTSSEDIDSNMTHNEDWWEPEMIFGNFAAISACQTCKQKMYITGVYEIVEDYDEDEEGRPRINYIEAYSIRFITPSIQLLKIPQNTPEEVKQFVDAASEVVFASPDLAANRIRSSIDILLTEQKIPRFKIVKGKQVKLSTHHRIVLYEAKNKEAAGLLEAVKWIGNEGTHNNSLTMNDLLEGLEIYSLSLEMIYDNNNASIKKKAKQINKNKGIKKLPATFK